MSFREIIFFVYTFIEKDLGKVRYGICVNFFRFIERKFLDKLKFFSVFWVDDNGNID